MKIANRLAITGHIEEAINESMRELVSISRIGVDYFSNFRRRANCRGG